MKKGQESMPKRAYDHETKLIQWIMEMPDDTDLNENTNQLKQKIAKDQVKLTQSQQLC